MCLLSPLLTVYNDCVPFRRRDSCSFELVQIMETDCSCILFTLTILLIIILQVQTLAASQLTFYMFTYRFRAVSIFAQLSTNYHKAHC